MRTARRLLAGLGGVLAAIVVLLHASRPAGAQEQAPETLLWRAVSPARPGPTITSRELIERVQLGGWTEALSVSPDGRWVATLAYKSDIAANRIRRRWTLVAANGGAPIQDLGDAGAGPPDRMEDGRPVGVDLEPAARWAPDSRSFVYLRQDAGDTRLALQDRSGAPSRLISPAGLDVVDFAWAGPTLLFSARRNLAPVGADEARSGVLFDARFAPSAGLRPFIAAPSHRPLNYYAYEDGRVRPATSAERELLLRGANPDASASHPDARAAAFSSHGNLAWAAPASSDRAGALAPLALFAQTSSVRDDVQRCGAPACVGVLENLFWSHDSASVYFIRRGGHALSTRTLYRWRPGKGAPEALLATEDLLGDCQDSVAGPICFHEGPTQPRRLIRVDPQTGEMHTLFEPNPGFARFGASRIDRLDWRDAFGNETFAHLVYPRTYRPGRRYPLVIVQYRSAGFLDGGVGGEYPIPVLAGQDYFVLSLDRPEDRAMAETLSHPQLERQYLHEAYERRMVLSALETAFAELNRRGLVDPSRVAITGLSDGAETVYYALFQSHLFAAAIASTPPVDPYDYALMGEQNRAFARDEFGYTDPLDDDAPWRGVAPLYHVEDIAAPLLIQAGEGEYLRALPFLARMHAQNKPVEMYIFEDEHHIKQQPAHLAAAQMRVLQWLNFWLKGVEDGLAPEQAARWRAMRR